MSQLAPIEIRLTEEGHRRLTDELERLRFVEHPRIAERLRDAYDSGDAAETGLVSLIRHEEDSINRRIARLEAQLATATIVREGDLDPDVVQVGSRVVVSRRGESTRRSYCVVSPAESDPRSGYLSSQSPLGRALLGRRRGDVVRFEGPERVEQVRVESVSAG
ncbi:MAG: GreA/GreB family elongation factor [Thermoleophilia bacterium]